MVFQNSSRRLATTLVRTLVFLPTMCLAAFAQTAPTATVGYLQEFPGSDPEHYSITIAADGHSTYDSDGKLSREAEQGESFKFEFMASPATVTQVFDLARKASYFEGKVDSGKKNLASTGKKTLSYHDNAKNVQAEYNYSPNLAVQELTRLFQNMSMTLEFGRRLQFDYRYQKLALSDEMKLMEGMAAQNSLQELQALTPILHQIEGDTSVMNIVRARAQRLLAFTEMQGAPKGNR